MQAFLKNTRKDAQLTRMKTVGIVSHLRAQRSRLAEWLTSLPISHMICVRTSDDTNVVVGSQSEKLLIEAADSDSCEEDATGTRTIKCRKKVAPLLGIVQEITLRRAGTPTDLDNAETIRLHAPSQVLPKAAQTNPALATVSCIAM